MNTVSYATYQVLNFKTNITSHESLATVIPTLQQLEPIYSWIIDIDHPEKILSVHSLGLSKEEIKEAINKTGFWIEEC